MNHKVLFLLTAIATATAAETTVTPYVRLSGGGSYMQDSEMSIYGTDIFSFSFDPGYSIEGAAGLAFDFGYETSGLRLELALGFQRNEMDKVTILIPNSYSIPADALVDTSSLMLNGYLDINTDTVFTPYLLVGIGRAMVNVEGDDSSALATQFGGGVGYAINDHLTFDLGYKFFLVSDLELVKRTRIDMASHLVQLGGRIRF